MFESFSVRLEGTIQHLMDCKLYSRIECSVVSFLQFDRSLSTSVSISTPAVHVSISVFHHLYNVMGISRFLLLTNSEQYIINPKKFQGPKTHLRIPLFTKEFFILSHVLLATSSCPSKEGKTQAISQGGLSRGAGTTRNQ